MSAYFLYVMMPGHDALQMLIECIEFMNCISDGARHGGDQQAGCLRSLACFGPPPSRSSYIEAMFLSRMPRIPSRSTMTPVKVTTCPASPPILSFTGKGFSSNKR